MSNVKFSQLPNLGTPTATTIIPVVDGVTNYTVTAANLQSYVNNSTGNITGGNLTAIGNVAGTYILGNGSLLTGLPATYGNANVTAFLPTYSGNLNSVTAVPGAAITGTVANAAYATNAGSATTATSATTASTANSVAGANVSGTVANAAYATSAGSATSATTATTAGTVTTAAQANITSVGTLISLSVTGNITSLGNVAGTYILGNGSQLTGLVSTYGNANVAAYLPTYSGNLNSVTAVPGAAITGTVANATYATNAGVASSANSVAGANVSGAVALATVANTAYSVSGANVSGAVANATYATSAGSATTATSAVTAVTAGTVTTAAQPNITSVDTLTSLAVTGNISGGNVTGVGLVSGANLTVTNTITNSAGNILLGVYTEITSSRGNTSTAVTPSAVYTVQNWTANNNFTLNLPTGMTTGQSITLIITQDATGNRTMTPNASYKFAYSNKTLSTAANAIDMLSIFYNGTTYLCNLVKGYA